MRKKYFRITAYHPEKNLAAIFDSYGLFRSLKSFSRIFIAKGFEIIEASNARKFLDGSFPKIPYSPSHFYLQAIQEGMPTYTEYTWDGKIYTAIQVDKSVYIPDKKRLA